MNSCYLWTCAHNLFSFFWFFFFCGGRGVRIRHLYRWTILLFYLLLCYVLYLFTYMLLYFLFLVTCCFLLVYTSQTIVFSLLLVFFVFCLYSLGFPFSLFLGIKRNWNLTKWKLEIPLKYSLSNFEPLEIPLLSRS